MVQYVRSMFKGMEKYMEHKKMQKYKNEKQKTTITTSVTIKKTQYDFLKKHNLNFSAIVQDALNELMKGEKNEK